MFTRRFYYDAVKGYFVVEQYHLDQDDDDKVDALQEARWLADEGKRIKAERRELIVNRAITFALALVVIGLVMIVLGVLR